MIPNRNINNNTIENHIKSAGIQNHRSSRVSGSGIAPLPRISNAEAHARVCLMKYTQSWTLKHCLTVQEI